MSRFNQTATAVRAQRNTPDTTNLAGGEAFSLGAKEELATILVTSMCGDQFYRPAGDGLVRLRQLLDEVCKTDDGARFAVKAAVYARNAMGLRSITHATIAEVAHRVRGASWTVDAYENAIRRVDDITEIISYYIGEMGKPIPNSLKRALRAAFSRFSAYQLAKYKSDGSALSLRDAARLLHPKPTDLNRDALSLLIKGELKSTDTWESRLSASGTAEDKDSARTEAWAGLIADRKLGYLAILRNLRNIAKDAPQSLEAALEFLSDAEQVKRGNAFPYQIYLAMRAVVGDNRMGARERELISEHLNRALDIAVANVPTLSGDTVVLVDVSGSMTGGKVGGEKSTTTPAEVASLFAAMLGKVCNRAEVILFDYNVKQVNLFPGSTLATAHYINQIASSMGGGTNFTAPFQAMRGKCDRIIILSDMQGWVSGVPAAFDEYCRRENTRPALYSWDLAGYGTSQLPRSGVYLVAGFGNAVFDMMGLLESDKRALVHAIEQVDIGRCDRNCKDNE